MDESNLYRMVEMITTAGIMSVAPSVLAGAAVSNIIISNNGSKVANWVWKNLYLSKSLHVMFSENEKEKFIYLLIGLSIKAGNPCHSRRISLDSNILYLLKNDSCPYKGCFYDNLGLLIKDYIYLPIDHFYIPSLTTKDRKWTWILVNPMTNGSTICGFNFWTCSWFWGCTYKDLHPNISNIMLKNTIESYMNFPQINNVIHSIKYNKNITNKNQ